jgi:hypothetical protein
MKWFHILPLACFLCCGLSTLALLYQEDKADYQIGPIHGHNIGPVSGGLVMSSLPSSLASSFPEYDAPSADKWEALWVRSMKPSKPHEIELIHAAHPLTLIFTNSFSSQSVKVRS